MLSRFRSLTGPLCRAAREKPSAPNASAATPAAIHATTFVFVSEAAPGAACSPLSSGRAWCCAHSQPLRRAPSPLATSRRNRSLDCCHPLPGLTSMVIPHSQLPSPQARLPFRERPRPLDGSARLSSDLPCAGAGGRAPGRCWTPPSAGCSGLIEHPIRFTFIQFGVMNDRLHRMDYGLPAGHSPGGAPGPPASPAA